MKVIKSGARYSAIVGISENLKKLSIETGREYLFLNRGVNSVCNINLNDVVKEIDFNTDKMQVYPPTIGMPELREAINHIYFGGRSSPENILMVAGSTCGLDVSFQSVELEKIYLPSFFWGTYVQIMAVRNIEYDIYEDLTELISNKEKFRNSGVIICDPNNPLGSKYDDSKLLETIQVLNDNGTIVFIDSPYRRVFYDESDTFYRELLPLENVIIIESFSKSVGLSGQRIGFIHSTNEELNSEMLIKVLYASTGINAFSQILIHKLLTTDTGRKAVNEFREITVNDIQLNIKLMEEKGLLAKEFYTDTKPVGIFVIINRSEEELLEKNIGSVSLSYFTKHRKEEAKKYARICASVPHGRFQSFMERL